MIKFVASCFSLPLQYVDEDILEHFSFCGHTALEQHLVNNVNKDLTFLLG